MASLRVGGLVKVLTKALGTPKGAPPNPMFAAYVEGLEQRHQAAGPGTADADSVAAVVADWEVATQAVSHYKVRRAHAPPACSLARALSAEPT